MKKQTNQASSQVTAAILEAVDNQLRDFNPPEAKETYDRLITSGVSDSEARQPPAFLAVVLIPAAGFFLMNWHQPGK